MRYGFLIACSALVGCSTAYAPNNAQNKSPSASTQAPASQASPDDSGIDAADVISRIKAEVGLYEIYERGVAKTPALNDACRGFVNFHITKVKMTLTTMASATVEADPKLTLPLTAVPGLTLAVPFTSSHATKGTQTLTFIMYPMTDDQVKEYKVTPFDPNSAKALDKDTRTPLADTMKLLRKTLLEESNNPPCFLARTDNKTAVSNTVSFLMDVDSKGSGGINFSYFIFGLNASRSTEKDNSNQIEITFEPYLVNATKAEQVKLGVPSVGHETTFINVVTKSGVKKSVKHKTAKAF